MPRTADQQAADHYEISNNAHHIAITRYEPGDHEYNSLMLEGILHAVLDLGVGLAELAALVRQQGRP
jgi:hypothetical protein